MVVSRDDDLDVLDPVTLAELGERVLDESEPRLEVLEAPEAVVEEERLAVDVKHMEMCDCRAHRQ